MKKQHNLRDVEGVETWVNVHVGAGRGHIDITKEVLIWTHDGNVYPVCIESTSTLSPPYDEKSEDSTRTGVRDLGILTVSGITCEQHHPGDFLVQKKDAGQRSPRKHQNTVE